LDGAVV
jgi:arginyl-tRNA synthetase